MSKSFGSIWLKGVKSLMKIQRQHASRLTAQRKAAASAEKKLASAAKRAAAARAKALAVQERAVLAKTVVKPLVSSALRARNPVRGLIRPARAGKPKAAASHARVLAKGNWTRSFFSAPPAAGELVNHLVYGLYLPPGPRAAALPLVVMLHGCQQTIEDFANGTRMNALADKHGFAVLYPEQSKHAQSHRCWHWYDESPRAGGKEVAGIAALVSTMVDREGLDATRVYVAGISAGAGMATVLALRYPHLFAAVALHSGPAFGGARTAGAALGVMQRGVRADPVALITAAVDVGGHPGMPALIIQGDMDPVVSAVNAQQLEQQFLALNGALQADGHLAKGIGLRVEEAGDGAVTVAAGGGGALRAMGAGSPGRQAMTVREFSIGKRAFVRVCRIAGLAHGWSGGDDAFAFHSARGPDASGLVWGFFSGWRRG